MKYTIPSITGITSNILDFFTGNKSLSATITQWVANNTANSCIQNSLFTPLPSFGNSDNFAPANEKKPT